MFRDKYIERKHFNQGIITNVRRAVISGAEKGCHNHRTQGPSREGIDYIQLLESSLNMYFVYSFVCIIYFKLKKIENDMKNKS